MDTLGMVAFVVLLSMLMYGLVYFPLFASQALESTVGYTLGGLYVWVLTGVEIYSLTQCEASTVRKKLSCRGVYPVLDRNTPINSVNLSAVPPMTRFDVRSDVRYRFRVIHAGALRCPIELSVDRHSLLLVASDGQALKPITLASILIFSGERYDFVLQTSKELSGLHWVRARGMDLCEAHGIQQFAILNYVDRHVTCDVNQYPLQSTSYESPPMVEGLELICNSQGGKGTNCSQAFCECIHVVSAKKGEVVELVVYNSNDQYGYTHPLHLHGYSYRVVAAERNEHYEQ
ncbi:hypothetical protein ACOMHN_059286 [Nucella lapillus]